MQPLTGMNEYLFLKLALQRSGALIEKDVTVNWNISGGLKRFEVGRTYLPHTLIVSPSAELIIETEKNSYKLSENSALLINENEKFRISCYNSVNSGIIILFLGKDSVKQYYDSVNPNIENCLYDKQLILKKFLRNETSLSTASAKFITSFDNLRYERMYLDHLHEFFISRMLDVNNESYKEVRKLDFRKQSTREEIYKRLYRSVEFMEDMYNRNIGIDELAKESHISKYHYIRLFKMLFSTTPYSYLSNVRITKAKNLLLKTNLPVSDISHNLGYENASHFSLNLKKTTGISPLAYRKKSNIV